MTDGPPWHEDEAFWERVRPVLFPPETLERAVEEVDQVESLVNLPAGADVLDDPCGVGRHAVELAGRGYEVTGVDATAAFLETARQRAADVGVDVEFVEADMREFSREGAFDAVPDMYTSFGYVEYDAENRRVAENFHASLRDGGSLVMSLAGREPLASDFREKSWEASDGTSLLEERRVTEDFRRVETDWTLIDDEGVAAVTVTHRLYAGAELAELLAGVGFATVDIYGDLEGSAYDQDAEQLVVVARK